MTGGAVCPVCDVADHIERYLELGAENVLGLGCDLDGTDLPSGFGGVSDLYKIAEELSKRGISADVINKIFHENYYSFIKRNF